MTTSKPTEGMLDAALHKIIGMDSHIDATPRGGRKVVHGPIAAIAAEALATLKSSPVEAVAVKIKPLEWQPNSQSIENSLWANVEAINRHYTIEPESHVFRVEMQLSLSEYGPERLGLHPTLDAAKAAAQADYETRIRSFLAPLSNPEAPAAPVGETAILREWFGGDRYARDYEYLDANFMENAKRVAALVATPPAPDGLTIEGLQATIRLLRLSLKQARGDRLDASPAPTSAVDGEIRRRLEWIAEARSDENADLDTICTYADQALALLSHTQAVPATMGRAGEMVLVPREPTREMLEAAADAPDDDDWLSAMAKAYRAMLLAYEGKNP